MAFNLPPGFSEFDTDGGDESLCENCGVGTDGSEFCKKCRMDQMIEDDERFED